MRRKASSLLTALILFSLILTPIGQGSVLAQEEQPPPRPSARPPYPTQSGVRYDPEFKTGVPVSSADFALEPADADEQSQQDVEAQLTLGQPGLSFRYVRTFGVTEEAYPADTTHLNRPMGLFMDNGNNLYVTEDYGNRVLKYSPAGSNLLALGTAGLCITDDYMFCSPKDAALDNNGNLWVADGNRVVQYDVGGTFLQQLPAEDPWAAGDDNTHFNYVNGIAFDGLGRMYVSDTYNHRVQVYTFSAGSPVYHSTIGVTGTPGSNNARFDLPYRLTVDSSNRVYVVDQGNNRVQRCTRGTSWVCTTFSTGLNGPHGITSDAGNNIYIADTYNGRIVKCLSNGTCTDFVTNTYGFYDLEVDSDGNVYGAAAYDAIVVKYNSTGAWLGIFLGTELVHYETDGSHFYQPRVAIDGQDNLIIIEELGQRLTKLDPDGNLLWSVGVPGLDMDDNDHFMYPHGVATDAGGKIYVADGPRVQIFSADGTYLNTIGSTWGSGTYQFQWASGIAVDQNHGNIYVADAPNQRVQVYNSSRTYLGTIGVSGVPGSDNSHFDYPIGVEVDASGNIYVADINNCRVQKYSSSRVYLKTFGTPGSCTDSLGDVSAEDVTVDANGRVYVAGWDNRVQVFNSSGAYLTTIGGAWGNQSSQFRGASGVAVDSQGNIYVSDFNNSRIQKFAPGVPGWQQVNINGFGDITFASSLSLTVFNNELYAGAANWSGGGASIWRTSNGTSWSRVMASGFGLGSTNPSVIGMIAFNGHIYAGTGWGGAPGQLWRSSNGTSWSQITGNGMGVTSGPISTFVVYNNTLYAGTCGDGGSAGAQIWRSTTGSSGSWTTVVTGGNTTTDNNCITGLETFNGALYAAVENQTTGAQIWRSTTGNSGTWSQVNTSGFGTAENDLVGGLAVYNGNLYIGTRNLGTGAQLWRSSNGSTWNPVMTDGFGDVNNEKLESLFAFGGALYAGLNNPTSGLEVWQSYDGTTWDQINPDGFGDSNNQSTLWSNETAVFKDNLYMAVSNSANGLEIWRTMRMSISGNADVAGASLGYNEDVAKSASSSLNGNYSFGVPYNWSGTVTPSHACFTFDPVSRDYTSVTANQTSQNYTATIVSGCADVDVSIGGIEQGRFGLPSQGSTRASFAGLDKGPVQIESTNAVPLIGAERVVYKVNGVNTSFSEMMALPNSQLDTIYWLPWYNNKELDTQLRFGNVSDTEATVHVYIGGVEMTGSPYTLAPGASTRKSYAGIDKGPVKIESTVPIVAAERVVYNVNGVGTSFTEMMALPDSQLDTVYWLPWYNNKELDTQLRFGNVSDTEATVHVFIGGVEMTGSPYTLAPGASTRKSYAGIDKGPVQIESDVPIVAAERVVYNVNGVGTSFTEMMALPDSQLDRVYVLPWYNNKELDTQLRFGNVSDTEATVHVFIGGVEMTGSPYTLAPGASTRKSYAGIDKGPVLIESDVPIVAAERVVFKVNGVGTSFSEMMALPNTLLDSMYWLPWYNNKELDTQLRFGAP